MRQTGKLVNNSSGFTLLEMLFSLAILMILLTITVPLVFSTIEKQTEKEFFKVFKSDVLFLQNQSIGTNQYYRLVFYDDHYKIIDSSTGESLVVRTYPNQLTVDGRLLKRISFNARGTIKQPGTMTISTEETTYRIIFPLGKGRFYIDER